MRRIGSQGATADAFFGNPVAVAVYEQRKHKPRETQTESERKEKEKEKETETAANPEVYVLDAQERRVAVFDLQAQFLRTFGRFQLTLPEAMALDRDEQVHVLESKSNIDKRIVVFRADGSVVTQFELEVECGRGVQCSNGSNSLAIDESGRVYVSGRCQFGVGMSSQFAICVFGFVNESEAEAEA